MKKLFIAILGVAAFAACSQEMTLETPKGAAIGFDNVFVENATRAADLTANNITDFGVYGFIKNASGEGQIFDNQLVSKSGNAFTYSPAQYWLANADYYFAAVAPAAKAEGYAAVAETPDAGVLSFNNETAAANTDLLFAYYKRDAVAEIKEAPAPVAFTFDHVLSRVKFSFKNGFGEGQNIELKVTNVNVKNAIAKGTLALEAGVLAEQWADQTGAFNVAFGNAGATLAAAAKGTTEHFYLIPADAYEYEVTFDVTLYQAGVELDTYNRSAKVTVDLLRGNSYELTATLNASNVSDDGENALFPIEFTINKVNEWMEAPVAATTLPSQIAGLTLVSDAVAGNLYLEGSFDGAGHTLTADVAATWTANGYLPFITTNGDSKISNLTIDGANHKVGEYGIRGVYFNGNLTLDNVTIKNVTYTINDNGVAKTLTVVNSTLEGWTSYNPATVARFENVAFVSGGTYNTVRPHGTTTFKNCSFDGTTIDLSKLGADKEIKFIGCTYNGQPLVYANLSDAAGKKVSVDYVVTSAPTNNGLVSNTEVVENMTIDGGNYTTTDGKGLRGIYITKGGNYTVNNVIVRNVTYAINVNTTEAVTLTVSNSTLEGWTSWGTSTTASFKNVKFTCGKYANLKPYTSTTLKDCSFEAGFMIDFTKLTGVITLKNCTYNGTVLTAENFAHIVKIDGDYTGKIAF